MWLKCWDIPNTAKAIRTHCKGVDKMDTPTSGGIQTVKIIPERDVAEALGYKYLPTLSVNTASVRIFSKWVIRPL
jgi:hypothetical protein